MRYVIFKVAALLVLICVISGCATGGQTLVGTATGGTVIVSSVKDELEVIFDGLASTLNANIFTNAARELSGNNDIVSDKVKSKLKAIAADQNQPQSVRMDAKRALELISRQ
ncbi:MAG: hypothetical protein GY845_27550 [Planctomycetes bacterium]|nr:hypothetical protein [Planctomycetota bacterium]